MAKVFYIANDEEVTSVVDKLRSTTAKEVIFMVPERALVIQSIVNLKLLKRESQQLKKKIILVTKDKVGRILAEKSGILVSNSLDDLNLVIKKNLINKRKTSPVFKQGVLSNKESEKARLEQLGSNSYFSYQISLNKNKNDKLESSSETGTKNLNLSKAKRKTILKRNKSEKINYQSINNLTYSKASTGVTKKIKSRPNNSVRISNSKNTSQYQINKINNLRKIFKRDNNVTKGKPYRIISRKTKYILFFLFFSLIITTVFLTAYLWLPKALIKADLKKMNKEVEMTTLAKKEKKDNAISLRIIEGESQTTKNYLATGQSEIADKKARGVVILYNKSSKPQPLVATTRLLSEEGKLFRLVKGVVVPPMKDEKPGQIIVSVVANKAGEDFNISPSKFTIPGLKGSEKYNKIYARSEKNMIGGGGEEKMKVISATDIEKARKQTLNYLLKQISEKEKSHLYDGENFTQDMIDYEIIESFSSPGENVVASNFDFNMKIKYKIAVLNENELKQKITQKVLDELKNNKIKWDIDKIDIYYGKNDCDFNAQTCLIKVNSKVFLKPEFNLDNFKKDVEGKTETELKQILDKYPQIEAIQIEFSPKYIPIKIPNSSKRLEIIIK